MLSNKRVLIVSSILITGIILLNLLPNSRSIPIKKPLESFPRRIGNWVFSEQVIFSDKIVNFLGVDDYIQFKYFSPEYLTEWRDGETNQVYKNVLIG